MIPWVRDRWVESRARWQNRKQRNNSAGCEETNEQQLAAAAITNKNLSQDSIPSTSSPNRHVKRLQPSDDPFECHPHQHGSSSLQTCSKWMSMAASSSSAAAASAIKYSPTRCQTINNRISIRVLNQCGNAVIIHVPQAATIVDIKMEAMRKFILANKLPEKFSCDTDNLIEFATQYKLKRCNGHIIDEQMPIENIVGHNDDEWLLIRKKNATQQNALKMVNDHSFALIGPTQSDIDIATIDVEQTSFPTPAIVNIDELVLQSDVQYDIRKILISLANACAYVIGSGPYAIRMVLMLKQRLIRKRRQQTDTVQCFVDMGFPRAKAVHALQIKNNVYEAALEWLIENHSPPGVNLSHQSPSLTLSTAHANSSMVENIESLLEIIKIYCQREIPPPSEMIQLIIDMGFDESTAREALSATKNNQAAACEWLVGSRTKIYMAEQTDGLPNDSPILIALLASPHVQLSLSNPKMFLAYLSILEDYSTMSMWMSDTETSGIIGHILRTYHEEKHILAINQFSSLK